MANLEDILLREVSQSQKARDWFYLHEVFRVIKIIKTKSIMVAVRGWQRGNEDLLLTGIELN